MPRFYFDVHDGDDRPDPSGVELADIVEARREAGRLAAELLREAPLELLKSGRWWLDVKDADGALLFVIEIGVRER